MKLASIAALMLAAPAAAAPAIERVANPSPTAIILQGVVVPPGAETFILSGQLASPLDPAKPTEFGDTKTQAVSTFTKIKAILEARGWSLKDVVKLTVFTTAAPGKDGRMDFAGFNEAYKMFFGTADNPNLVARSTVQVAALAGPNFLIEIEAVAARMPGKK